MSPSIQENPNISNQFNNQNINNNSNNNTNPSEVKKVIPNKSSSTELFGGALLIFGLLIFLSLISFQGQISKGLEPTPENNLIGSLGHFISELLFLMFGKSAFLLGPYVLILGLLTISRSVFSDPLSRITAIFIMMMGSSVFSAVLNSKEGIPSSVAGGVIGANGSIFLTTLFGNVGTKILSFGILMCGTFMAIRMPISIFVYRIQSLVFYLVKKYRQIFQSSWDPSFTIPNINFTKEALGFIKKESDTKRPWFEKVEKIEKAEINEKIKKEDNTEKFDNLQDVKNKKELDDLKDKFSEQDYQSNLLNKQNLKNKDWNFKISQRTKDLQELLNKLQENKNSPLTKNENEEYKDIDEKEENFYYRGYFDPDERRFHFKSKNIWEQNNFLLNEQNKYSNSKNSVITEPTLKNKSEYQNIYENPHKTYPNKIQIYDLESLEQTALKYKNYNKNLNNIQNKFQNETVKIATPKTSDYLKTNEYENETVAPNSLDYLKTDEYENDTIKIATKTSDYLKTDEYENDTENYTEKGLNDFEDNQNLDNQNENDQNIEEEQIFENDNFINTKSYDNKNNIFNKQEQNLENEQNLEEEQIFENDNFINTKSYDNKNNFFNKQEQNYEKANLSNTKLFENNNELEITSIPEIDPSSFNNYKIDTNVLQKPKFIPQDNIAEETTEMKLALEKVMHEYGIQAEVLDIRRGPIITLYELKLESGIKLSRVLSLQSEICMNLAVPIVRIIAPIPGKSTIGIEIPNRVREPVLLSQLLPYPENEIKGDLQIVLGKNIEGVNQYVDLSKLPHLLIAGATGAGKSVFLNTLIASLIYQSSPLDIRIVMIDPKMVELKLYEGIPHLLMPVITDVYEASKALRWVINEMERRYRILSKLRCRDIKSYNNRLESKKENISNKIPYIVIIIDELSDLMMVAAKDVEDSIIRLTQKARAVGIHIVMATQRPSVDVITALIKANCPARIAFQVAQRTDSRTILDANGAENLLGRGDLIYKSPMQTSLERIQAPLVTEDEVEELVKQVKKLGEANYVNLTEETKAQSENEELIDEELFQEALDIILESGKTSTSYLQRRLRIGYNKAASIIELMEDRGYLSTAIGTKPREILKKIEI